MGKQPRSMRLTAEHVAFVHRVIADPGLGAIGNVTLATDADQAQLIGDLLRHRPDDGAVWVFAYGSLIWNPACEIAETRLGRLRGYHRAFCLGWDRRFRGTAEKPGLMLALDHGGTCRGVLQRIPDKAIDANLMQLMRREYSVLPPAFPPRWVSVETEGGRIRAIAFVINRRGRAYVGGVAAEQAADALAVAVGFRGSMAEYVHSTVSHLEGLGIGDSYLWRMQEMIAERIERAMRG